MNQVKRGFTLIELAIVIVIAGILAAIAVPIYQTLVEQAKWSEAEGIAATIESAIRTTLVQNSGNADGEIREGDFNAFAQDIGLTVADINDARYFAPANIGLEIDQAASPADAVTYTIYVVGQQGTAAAQGVPSSESGAPFGYYVKRRGDDGEVIRP